MLAHLSEGDKSDGREVIFAKVPKHWETVIETEVTEGNFHCWKWNLFVTVNSQVGRFVGYPQTK